MKISKRTIVLFALCSTALFGGISVYSLATTSEKAEFSELQYYAPATKEETLRLVNIKRGETGVEPLIEGNELSVSAQFKAEDMANRSYFNHADPTTGKNNGIDKAFELSGTFCSYIGENIYSGTLSYTTSKAGIDWWMGSPPHREALLDKKYSYTGIGIAIGKDGTVYQVQHFCMK